MLERLKQYKEFILILTFFVTGFAWIYGIFVTKELLSQTKEQFAQTHCMLSSNIQLVDHQLKVKLFFDEILLMDVELSKLKKEKEDGLLDNTEIQQMIYKVNRRNVFVDRMNEARKNADDILNNLLSNRCILSQEGRS